MNEYARTLAVTGDVIMVAKLECSRPEHDGLAPQLRRFDLAVEQIGGTDARNAFDVKAVIDRIRTIDWPIHPGDAGGQGRHRFAVEIDRPVKLPHRPEPIIFPGN